MGGEGLGGPVGREEGPRAGASSLLLIAGLGLGALLLGAGLMARKGGSEA